MRVVGTITRRRSPRTLCTELAASRPHPVLPDLWVPDADPLFTLPAPATEPAEG